METVDRATLSVHYTSQWPSIATIVKLHATFTENLTIFVSIHTIMCKSGPWFLVYGSCLNEISENSDGNNKWRRWWHWRWILQWRFFLTSRLFWDMRWSQWSLYIHILIYYYYYLANIHRFFKVKILLWIYWGFKLKNSAVDWILIGS